MRARRGPIQSRATLAVLAIAFVCLVPVFGTYDDVTLLTQGFVFAVVAVSLDLAWGYTGILDMGHSIWFGLGALGVGIATTTVGPGGALGTVDGGFGPHLLGAVVAIGVSAAVAAVVGWYAFSSRGQTQFYIAIISLALGTVAETLYLQFPSKTGGDSGLFGFQLSNLSLIGSYTAAAIALGVAIVIGLIVTRSDFGVLMRAVRDQERRVSFLGFNLTLVKVLVFVGGAMMAAAAGGLYGMLFGLVSSPLFGLITATNFLVWTAVGGRGTIIGPAIGAIVLNVAQSKLNQSAPVAWELFVGALFLVVVVFLPDGIIAPLRWLFGRLPVGGPAAADRTLVAAPRAAHPPADPSAAVLSLRSINFGYGSRRVLRDLSLDVRPGELLCVVGPNGAGKSTLLALLADGRVRYDGEVAVRVPGIRRHRRRPPHALARAGIVRKFQTPDLFPTLTVAETILLASRGGRMPSPWRRTSAVEVPSAVLAIAEATGLAEHTNRPSGLLAHGLKQGLELAAVVSSQPRLVLLDEPTAGLTANEREVIGDILTDLVRDQQMTVVLIEHDLDFVLRIADRIAVLADGTVVECDSASAVAVSPVVRDVYVGTVGAVAP